MRKKNKFGFLAIILIVIWGLMGCSGVSEQDSAKAIAAKASAEDVQEKENQVQALQSNNEIPQDGVITAAQFKTVAGEDMMVSFSGTNSDMTYTWTYNAKEIQNPIDQNLLINKTDADVEAVQKKANNATVGLGLEFQNSQGQVSIPEITLTLSEKLDADTLILCTLQDDQVVKICDVTVDNRDDKTVLTFAPTTTKGTCYIVGGKSTSAQTDTNSPEEDSESPVNEESNEDNENTENQVDDSENANTAQEDTNVCTIAISCKTVLNNMSNLKAGKEEFIPTNGIILDTSQVNFTPGENVHDVLTRVCQDAGIQMESSFTPAYNSAYLEGINQLYEFDCGEQSGWMYQVNGWFPNYGCSLYEVQPGDSIVWEYTCDLGRDVGGDMTAQ